MRISDSSVYQGVPAVCSLCTLTGKSGLIDSRKLGLERVTTHARSDVKSSTLQYLIMPSMNRWKRSTMRALVCGDEVDKLHSTAFNVLID